MTVQAVFEIQKPEKVSMRLSAVMTLEDWKKVRAELKAAPAELDHWHPANQFVRAIDELVQKAEKEFIFYGENAPEKTP